MNLIEIHSDCFEIQGANLDEIEIFIADLAIGVNKGNDNEWAYEAEYYIKLALSNVLYNKKLMERAVQLLSSLSDYKQVFNNDDA